MTPAAARPGDLLYCRSDGPVGELIRFGQDTRYYGWATAISRAARRPVPFRSDVCWGNHIAVVGDGCLIEALAKGVTRSPSTKYDPADAIVLPLKAVRPDVTVRERQAAVDFAEAILHAGDPGDPNHYDYGWFGFASIVGQLTTPERFDVCWNGAMICSAVGARAWEHAGVTVPTRSPYTTMPADLRAMVSL